MLIKKNAIFIADVHYNNYREEVLELLEKIYTKEIEATQLFLMGDIFDFLCDEADYFQYINRHLIDLINQIAHDMEVIYFEGNHDYNLKSTFPKLQVIPREAQPVYTKFEDKKVALAHGDIFTPKGYDIYCKVIRNNFLLSFLNIFDINNWLTKIIEDKLKRKKICHTIENYFEFVEKRVSLYGVDLAIEGHFHQGYKDNRYINVPSLACSSQYMIYDGNEFKFIKV